MSDNAQGTPGAIAPGLPGATVIETPTVTPTDTRGMGESQARAMKWVDEVAKPAILRGGDSNPFLLAKNREALDHVFNGGPAPEWLMTVNGEPQTAEQIASGVRPHDPLREVFEAAQRPANEQQIKGAIDGAVVQGVTRELATQVGTLCGALELSEGHTKTILDRVRAHHGATHEHSAESAVRALGGDEVAEYHTEATRAFGSAEKFREVSDRAREFLEARGMLKDFDSKGLTRTSLAFDPKFLHTLAMAADTAGIPRGAKAK